MRAHACMSHCWVPPQACACSCPRDLCAGACFLGSLHPLHSQRSLVLTGMVVNPNDRLTVNTPHLPTIGTATTTVTVLAPAPVAKAACIRCGKTVRGACLPVSGDNGGFRNDGPRAFVLPDKLRCVTIATSATPLSASRTSQKRLSWSGWFDKGGFRYCSTTCMREDRVRVAMRPVLRHAKAVPRRTLLLRMASCPAPHNVESECARVR